jgi:uncharacterized protein (DUF2225 family)
MKKKPSVLTCPRCELINVIENKYCSKCSYPLVPSAFEEIKIAEERRLNQLEEKYQKDIIELRKATDYKLERILSIIQANPKLAKIKIKVLEKI